MNARGLGDLTSGPVGALEGARIRQRQHVDSESVIVAWREVLLARFFVNSVIERSIEDGRGDDVVFKRPRPKVGK